MILTVIYLLYIYKYKIYNFCKKQFLRHKKVKKVFEELRNIKNIIFLNKSYFQLILILFFFLSIFQCYIFYLASKKFGLEISLINAFFIYLSSILFSTLLLINFVGFFEITLTISAALITNNYLDMIFIGFGLRILNIISILFWILFFTVIHKIILNQELSD